MNERIRELEARCWTQRLPEHGPSWFDFEKFAELIVRECARVADINQAENMDWNISEIILEHFGVE